jgi:microcystin degradation protein MlrC
MASKPTQRSLAHLRAMAGSLVAIVERWNPHAKVRQDLFGFADLVAVIPGVPGTTYVQTTSGANVAHRLAKIREEPVASRVRACLAAGNTVMVHGWRKSGARGARKVWTLREVVVTRAEVEGQR